MATFVGLWVVAQLLANSVLAVLIGRFRAGTPIVYGVSFAACVIFTQPVGGSGNTYAAPTPAGESR